MCGIVDLSFKVVKFIFPSLLSSQRPKKQGQHLRVGMGEEVLEFEKREEALN